MSPLAAPVAAVRLPVAVSALAGLVKRLTRQHGADLTMATVGRHLVFSTPGTTCRCASCGQVRAQKLAELTGDITFLFAGGMVVCPACGNKRCPAATHHDHQCTGSNASGQTPTCRANCTDGKQP